MQMPHRLRPWLPLLLAHHPGCVFFDRDVYRIGRARFCVGCFTAYPLAAALLLALSWRGGAVSPWIWLGAGMLLGSVEFLAVAGFARQRRTKILVKAALGLGIGMAVYGLASLPLAPFWKAILFGTGAVLAGVAILPRGLRIIRRCRDCAWDGDWQRCPGFVPSRRPWPA